MWGGPWKPVLSALVIGAALIFCGVRYGSAEAVRLTREWLGAVQRLSYLASSDIAAE